MEITNVSVMILEDGTGKFESSGRLKAIASVTFNDDFVVNDIKVLQGDKGLFIGMPSKKTPNGSYKDIAHPINQKTRDKIQSAILAKYEEQK